MYAHKLARPQSDLIKYRGNTSQIDRKDTIINILSKNPGLIGARVADKIFDKKLFPVSYGKVYEVLKQLCREGSVVRSGQFYYLIGDAVSHDMTVTVKVAEQLDEIGVDLNKARFLSSGIIMAAEAHIAESKGENFNIDETVATGVASQPIPQTEIQISAEEYSWCPEEDRCEYASIVFTTEDDKVTLKGSVTDIDQFCRDFDIDLHKPIDEVDDVEIPVEVLADVKNPFSDMSDEDREALQNEAQLLFIAQEKEAEEAEALRIEKEADDAKRAKLRAIRSTADLEGQTVEINPGSYNGQVIGSVIEVRPSGMTFLITHSDDESIEFGTVMPMEYSTGLKYKILFDFDA